MENEELTQKEWARRGGLATKNKYGIDALRARGQKGGSATKAKYGIEYYKEINKKSQETKRNKKLQLP